MTTNDTQDRDGIIGGALTVALLITLAVQNAVPPMATDMYSAAFPQITADLATNSTMLGFTLTTFFVGYATGQVLGGAISDQIGRRRPIIAGGIIALVGSIICVLTPNIWVLLVGRVFQGLGGGVASSVARAILVDVAHGKTLARAMSLIQAIVGFAPMLAPVLGAFIITHATWRVIFWSLAGFTLLMAALAWFVVPESLPEDRRHPGRYPAVLPRPRPSRAHPSLRGFHAHQRLLELLHVRIHLERHIRAPGAAGPVPHGIRVGVRVQRAAVDRLRAGQRALDLTLHPAHTHRHGPHDRRDRRGHGHDLDVPPRPATDPHVRGLRAHHDGERVYLRQLRCTGHERGARARGHGFVRHGRTPVDCERHRRSPGDLRRQQPMVLVMMVGSVGAWFAFWVIARGGKHTPRHLSLD